MLFDSAVLHAVAAEVRDRWLGRRVQQVQQSSYQEVAIAVGGRRELSVLQVVITPDAARVHLVSEAASSGEHPTPFCMALRKHLRGAVVTDVRQPRFDRVLGIEFSECEGLGPACRRTLIAEIMGCHSNIVLLDEHEILLACAKHITRRVNRYREVIEGIPYVSPPTADRLDPLTATPAELRERLESARPGAEAADWLRAHTMGASLVWVAEVLARAGVDADAEATQEAVSRLVDALTPLRDELRAAGGQAVIHTGEGLAPLVYPLELHHLEGATRRRVCSISAALAAVGSEESTGRQAQQLRNQILQAVRSALQSARRRWERLQARLDAADNADELRLRGDMILANLAAIEPGAEAIEVPDPADADSPPLHIKLDRGKSPSENAQAYFRRYKKAKQAAATIPPLLDPVGQDIQYLEAVRFAAESAGGLEELQEIQEEMVEQGVLSAPARRRARPAYRTAPSVGRATSSDGLTILFGRSNKQNDCLLRHEAHPDDIWLHVRNAPSAHVIIRMEGRQEDVPEATLLEAAGIAAAHSALRDSALVEVDYTLRKHVRKPKGARPGFVTYSHFRTVAVEPAISGAPSARASPLP